MKYTAVCLSKAGREQTFNTEEEADAYITKLLCRDCLECIRRGYSEIQFEKGESDQFDVLGWWDTSCGAEWTIEEVN